MWEGHLSKKENEDSDKILGEPPDGVYILNFIVTAIVVCIGIAMWIFDILTK